MTPRGTSPNRDGVVLSPLGVKLKWMYDDPTSEWSLRLRPPAIRQSQKLIRLPSVTNGNRIVCLSPTQCAPPASSSSKHPSRTWWPRPRLERARKTALAAYPPLSSTSGPSRQSTTVTGPSPPSSHPAEMAVFAPASRVPWCRVTPSPLIRSTSTSSAMSTAYGFGMDTPFASNCSTMCAPRGACMCAP